MATEVDIKQLLQAGAHFGHKTSRWNPKMAPYIHSQRGGMHILDLAKTVTSLETAPEFITKTVASGKQILLVGTKRQAKDIIKQTAIEVKMPYVSERWLGGMLTNYQTIQQRLKRLTELEERKQKGEFELLTKKEALHLQDEMIKLNRLLGGIRQLKKLPDMLFIIDTKKEHIGVTEANKLGLPIVAVVDTNCDPDVIDYVIPGNDDAIRAVKLITGKIADACLEGRSQAEARGELAPPVEEREFYDTPRYELMEEFLEDEEEYLPDISEDEFVALRDLIRGRFGIWYDDQKRFLLLSRLSTRLARRGVETSGQYVHYLTRDPRREDEWTELASVLSNNETYFFRERAQLKALTGEILDTFLKHSGRVRLWSAACSSGEEPYSLGMALLETGKVSEPMISIRATDISPRVLELAQRRFYRALSLRATEPAIIQRWFRPQGDGFVIDERIARLVSFARLNLLYDAGVAAEGPFDAIFCRNVLIYFDKPTQKRVVESFAKALRPGGYLFLGHAESLFHLTDLYEPIVGRDAIIYRLKAL